MKILFIWFFVIVYSISYPQETYENSVFLIQFCNSDTCKPLATGFLVYDDTLGTNQFYLVTNRHVVEKGGEYLNQIAFSRIDSSNKLINYSQSLIKDFLFNNSFYLTQDKDILWRSDNSYGQDIVIMKLLKDCELMKYYTPINLSESTDYIEIKKNDTLTTFGFPAKEWSIRENTKVQEIIEFFEFELQKIRIKVDSFGNEKRSLMNLRNRVLFETNPVIKDSLNIVISDSTRIIENKRSSFKSELNYLKKVLDDTSKSYYRNIYRPLHYQGYFNCILDSLIVEIDGINTMFYDIISASVFANSGQSGSPLFLLKEKKYYLIGIIFAKDKEHNSHAVPIKYLLNITTVRL